MPRYCITVLLYAFHEGGDLLLLERAREPNRGLWSPCGGKVETARGESPHAAACREAAEEIGANLTPHDLHLTGLVTERSLPGQDHWLMFLFEMKPRLRALPPPHREGRFQFVPPSGLAGLALPETDRDHIWPLFWRHRGGFFAARCHHQQNRKTEWLLEESRVIRHE